MITINHITQSFVLGFDCVCIMMALYMTYEQIQTYYDNEDFSQISFKKFTDGPNDKYPTYTICFADNYLRQLYKNEFITTSNLFWSDEFPYGRRIAVEGNKLIIWKNANPNEMMSKFLPAKNSRSVSNEFEKELETDREYHVVPKKVRSKRMLDVYQDEEVGYYSLRGLGRNMILFQDSQKTYTIAPQHYQFLLMGLMDTFTYEFDAPNDDPIEIEMNTTINDVIEFDFDDVIIDLDEFLVDFHLKMENGSTSGWIKNSYEQMETFCEAKNFLIGYGAADCHVEDSFQEHVDQRIPSGYPLKKVYQDPVQICYSPKLDPNIYRNSELLTLDIKNMFTDGKSLNRKFESKSSLPFMKVYVHMQGQFMRKIGKELAGFTAKDTMIYCTTDPRPPISTDNAQDCYGTRISIDVSEVTLLRSRHDAKDKCNPGLKDEDNSILESLTHDERLQCRPLYWKGLNTTSSLEECRGLSQYKYLSEITLNFTNYEKIRERLEPPCDDMIIVTNIQSRKGRVLQKKNFNNDDYYEEDEIGLYLDVHFSNINDRYQVTENSRAFTGKSCWAGVGGFVGIFVGASLMQLPELLHELYSFIKIRIFGFIQK